MQPAPPLLELAVRLRQLRLEHWADNKLTQGDLGRALGGDQPLSAATIASWENRAAPKPPPRERWPLTRSSSPLPDPRLLPRDCCPLTASPTVSGSPTNHSAMNY